VGFNPEPWAYDFPTSTWSTIAIGPSGRNLSGAAYNSAEDRTIVYGGNTASGLNAETWMYDYNTDAWTRLTANPGPPSRHRHSADYDALSDRMIVFGGNASGGVTGDTWSYDLNLRTWADLAPGSAPTARSGQATSYAGGGTDRLLLFGGLTGAGLNGDTWHFDEDSNAWTQRTPAGSPPSARHAASMAYDASSVRFVLFGGQTAAGLDGGTFVYHHPTDTWSAPGPLSPPSARRDHAMVYIPYASGVGDEVFLFGGTTGAGRSGETWTYNVSTNAWLNKNPTGGPSNRTRHAMAFDAGSNRVVLFGGDTSAGLSAETWVYNLALNDWSNPAPSTAPSARRGHRMAYDAENDRVLLWGGENAAGALLNDTWAFDLDFPNLWENLTAYVSPPARQAPAMAYDSQSDRVALFGGRTASGLSSELWTFDLNTNTWRQTFPSGGPTARERSAMAYDAESDRLILFGGRTASGPNADTYALNLNTKPPTWTSLAPAVAPQAREGHGMTYDPGQDRAVLFGGRGVVDSLLNDTWLYNFNVNSWSTAEFGEQLRYHSGDPAVQDAAPFDLARGVWRYQAGNIPGGNVDGACIEPGGDAPTRSNIVWVQITIDTKGATFGQVTPEFEFSFRSRPGT
jgi:hypothetical protein